MASDTYRSGHQAAVGGRLCETAGVGESSVPSGELVTWVGDLPGLLAGDAGGCAIGSGQVLSHRAPVSSQFIGSPVDGEWSSIGAAQALDSRLRANADHQLWPVGGAVW